MEEKAGCFGITLTGLFVVFLVMKLFGAITWSWWWVTCPLWIVPALIVAGLLLWGCVAAIAGLIQAANKY